MVASVFVASAWEQGEFGKGKGRVGEPPGPNEHACICGCTLLWAAGQLGGVG